tara:strand:+ start:21 stop:320 length:300 start_codon:yes stop_codon:yes gene_type:complete
MVSLVDIYNIKEEDLITEDLDHNTKLTYKDPETGRMEWNVTYKTDLNTTYIAINKAVLRLEDLQAELPTDEKIKGFLREIKGLKNRFSRYRKQIEKQRR